ncbi:MAG: oligosaccharide flippase family protein [Rhodospirillales bacterium]|nr:oligosaccharide flippase family protein [Rhodospirillales bacterium]
MTIRRNIFYFFVGHWVSSALAFCTTVFVSRLLTPHEVGVFVIAISVATLVSTLQNFGTKEYLVQKIDLDEGHRRAAFCVSILTGLVATLLLAAASVPVAQFYHTPELTWVMLLLAMNPFLTSLAAPITGMLARERLFKTVSIIGVASATVNTVTAIALSYLGYSFYSLAYASLAATAAQIAGYWILGRQYLLARPAFRGSRAVLSFGTKVYLANIITEIQLSASELIIGKLLGLPAAALYLRAGSVYSIFSRLISRSVDVVMTSEYAALNRAGKNVAKSFLSTTGYMSAIAWPFFGFMGIYAEPVVRVLYGHQWTGAILPMQILCVAGALWPLNSPAIGVLLGTGAVGQNLRIRTVTLVVRLAMTLVAALISLEAVALAVVGSSILTFILYTKGARRIASFATRDYLRNLVPSVFTSVVTLILALACFWAGRQIGLHDVMLLLFGAAGTGLGWIAGLRLSKHPLWSEVTLMAHRGARGLGLATTQ